jgi:hypothetical protein
MHRNLRRIIVTFASVMMLVLAFAPLSFAGEDGCSDDNSCTSGGSDTGSAGGGAQTGFGGVIASTESNIAIPIALAGGGLALLTIAGGMGLRARRVEL